jgi:hypothetical protein
MKRFRLVCAVTDTLLGVGGVVEACAQALTSSDRICQLTGLAYPGDPKGITGMQMGSPDAAGITGTDMGWAVEHRGRLYFLFGDTRAFPANRCDPDACGTVAEGLKPQSPIADGFWNSLDEYRNWLDTHGNAPESMGVVAADGFAPDNCIPLTVPTDATGTFRPTRLDGRTLPRGEGAFSGFSDETSMYAFFMLMSWPDGCNKPDDSPCGHDDESPGGKSVLASSKDDGRRFEQLSLFSTAKFLFAAPSVEDGGRFPGLPGDLNVSGRWVVFVFGSGRERNEGTLPDKWNRSHPYLAVTALDEAASRRSEVWFHRVADDAFTNDPNVVDIHEPSQFVGAPAVGTDADDRWVLPDSDRGRILGITRSGAVWSHDVTNTVGARFPLTLRPNAGPVAANPTDKWVLVHHNRILVIREDGAVFAHRITPDNFIEPAFQMAGPPNGLGVGNRPEDNWVVVVGEKLVVITKRGRVFVHDLGDTTISNAIEAVRQDDAPIAGAIPPGTHRDRWVFGMGNKLAIVNGKTGKIATYSIRTSFVDDVKVERVDELQILTTPHKVAANPQDRWLLYLAPPGQPKRIVVIPYFPTRWRYYSGSVNGTPQWSMEERLAVSLPPFGPHPDIPDHKCLGYYSARYLATAGKWVMLYTCWLDYVRRGIYMRTASLPWGTWSPPSNIFDPGEAYCKYMHDARLKRLALNPPCTPNPYEDEKRHFDSDPKVGFAVREFGGEYAPFLLPSRYAERQGSNITLFYTISTWNPYQTVLMKTVTPIE